MGPGSDGPMSGLGGMDSHHMNGSLGNNSNTTSIVNFQWPVLFSMFSEWCGRLDVKNKQNHHQHQKLLKTKHVYISVRSIKVLLMHLNWHT